MPLTNSLIYSSLLEFNSFDDYVSVYSCVPLIGESDLITSPCTAGDLVQIFNLTFKERENTILDCGQDEPIYLPAGDAANSSRYNRIIFAHGFVNSALHEIAHWCIAGSERRKLVDYGYWYKPDGRSSEEQSLFEKVEVKPQALEWVLAKSCGVKFHISFDNLAGSGASNPDLFKQAVAKQALEFIYSGLPSRAAILQAALLSFFQVDHTHWNARDFCISSL